MGRRWNLGTFPDEVWVVPSFGSVIPAGAEVLSAERAVWWLDGWSGAGSARRVLSEILEAIGTPFVSWDVTAQGIRDAVRGAFASRVIVAYRLAEKLSVSVAASAAEEAKRAFEPVEEKTFIAIQLVDDADPPQPVPFKRYLIELPDHSRREGMLDENGKALVRGIDAGTCKITFPDVHATDWDAA